jgi:hypothetical protein
MPSAMLLRAVEHPYPLTSAHHRGVVRRKRTNSSNIIFAPGSGLPAGLGGTTANSVYSERQFRLKMAETTALGGTS